jgi:cysteine-rich repeat protein
MVRHSMFVRGDKELLMRNHYRGIVSLAAAVALTVGAGAIPAAADTVSGTVTFSGSVVFATPIAGIAETDLTVSSGPTIEKLGNGGEKCEFTAPGSAPVDGLGAYSSLAVGISVTKNGNGSPENGCTVQLQANGNDGAGVSAHGTVSVEVTLLDIQNSATIAADDIVVRQSKSVAGVDKYCLKYLKKQTKFRGKCNAALWKDGGTEGAEKCKFELEPAGCDAANYVEATLALSFGDMDQQTDPPSALAVDLDVVGEQAKCQKYIGKAAANFFAKRNQLVQKKCVATLTDTVACRTQQTNDARSKLSIIDNCIQTQAVDMSGLTIANVDEPCLSQAFTGLSLDRKLLRECLERELATYSDGAIGDVPICGNGVVQSGEACDDGNNTNGDCCNSVCGFEPNPGTQTCGVGACEATANVCNLGQQVTCTPNAPGVEAGNCADLVDNDCDGLTDEADATDCP